MANGTPTMTEIIRRGVDQALANVHTCMPGRVTAYNASEKTVDVQPQFKRKYVTETAARTLPIIPRVPLAFQRLGNAWLRLPVTVGDYVMLLFSERSLDRWMSRGAPTDPEFPSKHALADAIAVPGLYPATSPMVEKGAATSLELANGGAVVEMAQDGTITIKNDIGELEITPAGKFKFTNQVFELMSTLVDQIDALIAAGTIVTVTVDPISHAGGGTGIFNPGTLASLAQVKVQLEALKA